MSDLVSILLPVKNEEKFISDCLDSITDQSHDQWEVIAVDDHSTDDTKRILDSYSERDARIKAFSNEGVGIIPALHTAVARLSGDYLTRMDGDDIMPQERLSLHLDSLKRKPGKQIATGKVKYFSQRPVAIGYQKYEDWLNEINLKGRQWQNVYRECVVASPNWMMSTGDFTKVWNTSSWRYPEDYHLLLKCYQQGFQIQVVDKVTLLWREHPERTSRNSHHYNQESFFDLKISEFLSFQDNGQDILLWGTNKKGHLTAKILKDRNRQFHWMSLEKTTKKILGFPVTHYSETRKFSNPQVLLAIHPTSDEKVGINSYLQKQGLVEGQSFWYL